MGGDAQRSLSPISMRNIHNTIQDEGNREEGYVYLADLIKNYDKSKNLSSLEAP